MDKVVPPLIYVVLSILVVLLLREMHFLVHWIDVAHQWLLTQLSLIFSGDQLGRFLRMTLALVAVPLIVALIPAFFYWMIRGRWMPTYMTIVYVIWAILVTILAYR